MSAKRSKKAAPRKGAASSRKATAPKKPAKPARTVKTAPKASTKPVKRTAAKKPTKPAPRAKVAPKPQRPVKKAATAKRTTKAAPKATRKAPKATGIKGAAKLKPLRLVLQAERIVTPGRKTSTRADKYRYPKGHPKAGQYAPKSEAERIGSTRYVRRKSGKREAIEPTGSGKVKQTKTAPIGRSFTELAQAYTIADSVKNADEQGKDVFVRIGGKVYKVPPDRRLDVAAWVIDIKLKSQSIAKEHNEKGVSAQPVAFNFSQGVTGVFLDLDEAGFGDQELADEFGDETIGDDLAAYMARTADSFLGISVDEADILNAWGTDEDDPNEE
jgi:hypothetical protein